MCGYVKEKVYATKVTGIEDLKTWIRDVITVINTGKLSCAWEKSKFDWMFAV
jgi:hypothetical protein